MEQSWSQSVAMSAIEREISCSFCVFLCVGGVAYNNVILWECGEYSMHWCWWGAMQESETPIGRQHHALELHHRTNDLISGSNFPTVFQGLTTPELPHPSPHLARSITPPVVVVWHGLVLILLLLWRHKNQSSTTPPWFEGSRVVAGERGKGSKSN